MIRRIKTGQDVVLDGTPYILDLRTYDIPITIMKMIKNAPEGLVAVSLRPVGRSMIAGAERAARRRNARIFWLPIRKEI